jgi:hypothetical protein
MYLQIGKLNSLADLKAVLVTFYSRRREAR